MSTQYKITPSSVTLQETTGTRNFTVTRTGAAQSETATIYLSTAQTEGYTNVLDYVDISHLPLVWSAGQTTMTVSLVVLTDLVVEDDETFALVLQQNLTDPVNEHLDKVTFTIKDVPPAPAPAPAPSPSPSPSPAPAPSPSPAPAPSPAPSPSPAPAPAPTPALSPTPAPSPAPSPATEPHDGVTLIGSDANDVLIGTERDDVLLGGGGNDRLEGGAGNDVLDGGTGADTMVGGDGSDLYYVDDVGDLVVETAGNAAVANTTGLAHDVGRSVDKVIASISYTLASFVENLTLAADAGNLNGTGNELNNVLVGNAGNNVLRGGGGNDSLDGGAGSDVAVYSGKLADYRITPGATPADTTTVVDLRTGAVNEGSDTLVNIERLQFADVSVAYDLGMGQSAGKAVLALTSALGRGVLANTGLMGAALKYFDAGHTLLDGAQLLVEAGVMAALAGDGSNSALAAYVYLTLTGSKADPALVAALATPMDSHAMTQAEWLAMAAGSELSQARVVLAGLAHDGLQFTA